MFIAIQNTNKLCNNIVQTHDRTVYAALHEINVDINDFCVCFVSSQCRVCIADTVKNGINIIM